MNNYNANLEDLSKILSTARIKKGYSQRKVAKLIQTHHSTYNELEKGNIKKPDVDILKDLAEILDISLELLLTAAGYSGIAVNFRDKSYNNKSTRDLKNLIDRYRSSQMDLLQDSYDKRSNVADCRSKLHNLMIKLKDYDYYKEILPPEKILEEITSVYNDLKVSAEKYDYSKLPDDRINL